MTQIIWNGKTYEATGLTLSTDIIVNETFHGKLRSAGGQGSVTGVLHACDNINIGSGVLEIPDYNFKREHVYLTSIRSIEVLYKKCEVCFEW